MFSHRPKSPEAPPERARLLDEFMILSGGVVKALVEVNYGEVLALNNDIDAVLDDYLEVRSGRSIDRYHQEPRTGEFFD